MKASSTLIPLLISFVLSGCDSQPSGLLQQRIADLELQCDAARKRADQLQAKLDAKTATPVAAAEAPPKTVEKPSDDSKALVAASATMLGESLRNRVKPGLLRTYEEAAWAGFRLEKNGESRGVAVPFFRDSQGQWECGWSEGQIIEALNGQGAASVPQTTPPVPTSVAESSPQTSITSTTTSQPATKPAEPPAPPPVPQPENKPRNPNLPVADKNYYVDPATGKLFRIMPDGTRQPMPELR